MVCLGLVRSVGADTVSSAFVESGLLRPTRYRLARRGDVWAVMARSPRPMRDLIRFKFRLGAAR